jgi:hypothetical protein
VKYYGSILDFTQERNQELMRVYQEELSKAGYIVMPKIFEQVANSPCSRFWVSEERAAIVISTLLAGKVIPNMRKNKREMFDEIFRRFLIAREQYPEKSIYALAIMVVNQPAPKFYMTPRTVGELIYRIKNGWYEKQFNRYKNYSQVDKEEL